jgi:hypothetical protein
MGGRERFGDDRVDLRAPLFGRRWHLLVLTGVPLVEQ